MVIFHSYVNLPEDNYEPNTIYVWIISYWVLGILFYLLKASPRHGNCERFITIHGCFAS
jgi:hypothetical protein